VVLVTVLWSIALLSALAMAASVTFRGFAGATAVERDRLQADALLTAGLEAAVGTIDTLGDTPLVDVGTTITLGGGVVRLRLNDEGGRIDIGKAPIELIAALLRSVGAPDAAASVIARRIVGRRPAIVTAVTGGPFTDIRQLQSIPGIMPDWIAAMAPLTTVFGGQTVNPLTAPPGVIAALPGIDSGQVETFIKSRRSSPSDADRLLLLVGPAAQYLTVKSQRVAAVDVTAQVASGYVAAAHAVIVALPQDSQPYRVLVWTPLPSPGML
jgi:general secretion pathway protein K